MSFRVEGTSVVRSTDDGQDTGVCLAFTADMAQRIADALNESSTSADLRGRKDPLTGKVVDRVDVRDRTPLSEVLGEGQFVKIVGPYATAEMATPGGRQIRSLAEGAVLPGDVTAGTARHLIDVGLAQIVEAGSAREAHEGAPSQRHRVEAAMLVADGPTVGRPAEGTVAADYDRDPIAAARAAAQGAGSAPIAVLSGVGEAPLPEGDDDTGEGGSERRVGKPRPADDKATWLEYRVNERVQQRREGQSEEDARAQAQAEFEGKSKADLVAGR